MGALLGNGGVTMLFDPKPKDRREDLFDREEEIRALVNSVERYPLTLLLGIRRVGKSSILKVVLKEMPGIYIDVREIYFSSGGWISTEALKQTFERALNNLDRSVRGKVAQTLKKIDGIEVAGVSLSLKKEASLADVLNGLNEVGVVIALDEAQYLRFYGGRGGRDLLALVAYAYDNLRNVKFVLSGSEVGLLHDFVGVEDYESPLYGRAYAEVTVSPFTRDQSIEFLRRGFEEVGVEIEDLLIERAVEFLDGIPGWLVEFGYSYMNGKSFEDAMESVVTKARKFLEGELRELEKRSRRYLLILKAIASGVDRWAMIKDYVSARSGAISSTRLAEHLKNLERMGWIKKVYGKETRYEIIDPVVLKVLRDY